MTPIVTPLAASGFSPRALALLEDRLRPLGMAPMAGGAAAEQSSRGGRKPLVPGAPLSVAMVTGDFDLSGIGTVTHVEGNRVYGFGHPMFSLGSCELPDDDRLHPHGLSPRQRQHQDGLAAEGRRRDRHRRQHLHRRPVGPKPDMLPVSVRVKTGRYADSHLYKVQMVREPALCRPCSWPC